MAEQMDTNETTTAQHTPEPWIIWEGRAQVFGGPSTENDPGIIAGTRGEVAEFSERDEDDQDDDDPFAPGPVQMANAERAVVCVNALAGLTREQVNALPETLAEVRGFLATLRDIGGDSPMGADAGALFKKLKVGRE